MRSISEERDLDFGLAGMFIGFIKDATHPTGERPVLTILEGEYFLPIFQSKELLEQGMALMGYDPGTVLIKQIDDQAGFIESVAGKVRLMVNPVYQDGKTRFTEVKMDTTPYPEKT